MTKINVAVLATAMSKGVAVDYMRPKLNARFNALKNIKTMSYLLAN